jgi:mRNA interferase YafQ
MKNMIWTTSFKKDFKCMMKRGKAAAAIKSVIQILAEEKMLDEKCKDHPLVGDYAGTRDCHIGPDWLLIYQPRGADIVMVRTGKHSDLFK